MSIELQPSHTAAAVALTGLPNIYDLSLEQLRESMASLGEPRYRAAQVFRWLYRELATDFEEMTDLPSNLRKKLAGRYVIGSAELIAQKTSSDGWTRKALLRLRGGDTIEAVLMLYHDRATVCISSQVGCAMGCSFCATGQMGFTRNLTAGEIIEQVIWFNRWLREHPHRAPATPGDGGRYTGKPGSDDAHHWHVNAGDARESRELRAVTNIVFMGMGEPLVNYNNLWGAIRTITSPEGVGMGARRLTVSTVGIVPKIRQMAAENVPVNLALSLHAPNDALRSKMVPMNRFYPIADLLAACREYVKRTNRRITFEYVMIRGENDSLENARELAQLLGGSLGHVNLIPLNPVAGTGMLAPDREQVFAFQHVLESAGIATTVRIERGVDISAACGQLKVEEEPNSHRRSLNPDLVKAHVEANLAATV